MSDHTPGPWTTSFVGGFNRPALFATIDGKNVRLANYIEATEEDRALMAAAPDLLNERDELIAQRDALLDACKDAYETWQPLLADADLSAGGNPAWISVQKMFAAIEKAEGRIS